ncbi:MAG: LLM class flavin-dependent oxidoreductase, partial [Actinobacteria bacterium]|nr:LLM class flavin-dependent oxidoreductase [Actinomycetota bacterium]
MKLGIVTPVLSMNPRVGQPWELTATPEDIRVIAQEADRLGFHHLTCSEHVAVPSQAVSATGQARGTRYYDPAVTLSWMAAVTSRIALATHVLVGA